MTLPAQKLSTKAPLKCPSPTLSFAHIPTTVPAVEKCISGNPAPTLASQLSEHPPWKNTVMPFNTSESPQQTGPTSISSKDLARDIDQAYHIFFSPNLARRSNLHKATEDDQLRGCTTKENPSPTHLSRCFPESFGLQLAPALGDKFPTHLHEGLRLLSTTRQIRERLEDTESRKVLLKAEVVHSTFLLDMWRFDAVRRISFIGPDALTGFKPIPHTPKSNDAATGSPGASGRLLVDTAQFITTEQKTFQCFFFPPFSSCQTSTQLDVPAGASPALQSSENDCSLHWESSLSLESFPSYALTADDYRQALLKLPTLRFSNELSIFDASVIPDLKQDSKDLTRDILQINGKRISGTEGYQALYQTVATHLLPEHLRQRYTDCIENEKTRKLQQLGNTKSKTSTSLIVDVDDAMQQTFCVAEVRALVLLHILNRTFAGGHAFERVLSVFANEKHALIVPNSRGARPLDLIIGYDHADNVLAAILGSHTTFRVYPVTAGSHHPDDAAPYLTNVHAYFVADINLTQQLPFHVVRLLCTRIISSQMSNVPPNEHSSSEFLSDRLHNWINCTVRDMDAGEAFSVVDTDDKNNQPTAATPSSVSSFAHRIYITQHPCDQNDNVP